MKIFSLPIVLIILMAPVNAYAQYDAGTVIYTQTSTTNLTSISKNYIVEDFDGDSYADILMVIGNDANNSNQLTWYKGDGNGIFSAQTNIISIESAHWENEIFYEDMNGDGNKDIIFQDSKTGFTILFTNGQGNITNQLNNVATTGNLSGANLKEIADLDGDGDMDGIFFGIVDDMYFAHYFGIYSGYYLIGNNDGNGLFSNYYALDNLNAEYHLLIETGDVDGDSDLDIICSGNSDLRRAGGFGPYYYIDPFVRLYKNSGDNVFAPKQELNVPVINNQEPTFTHIKIQDLNGDNSDELMIEYGILDNCIDDLHLHNCVYFYQFQVSEYNTQSGVFNTLQSYNSWLHGYPLQDFYLSNDELYNEAFLIQFGHQNTDNNLDVLSINVPQGKLQWYLGDGSGNFSNTQLVNSDNQYSGIRPALRAGDIDNDTDLDIFVLLNNDTSCTLAVFKNLALTPSCVPVLDLGNTPLTNGVYQAGVTTISQGNVIAGNNVTLKAGNNVRLQSGFQAPQNSSLKVSIETCN